jgi:hypothetical protein
MTSKLKTDVLETVSGSGTIALTNQLSGMTSASMPSGSVIQVVNDTHSVETNSTSITYADTGLTASITPSSTSNYILIFVNHTGLAKFGGSAADIRMSIRLMRDASQIALIEGRATWNNSTQYNFIGGTGITFKDTPSSTSSITYKTQFNRDAGNGTVRINDINTVSTITLMEIQG